MKMNFELCDKFRPDHLWEKNLISGFKKLIVNLATFLHVPRTNIRLDIKNGILVKGIDLEGLRNLVSRIFFKFIL